MVQMGTGSLQNPVGPSSVNALDRPFDTPHAGALRTNLVNDMIEEPICSVSQCVGLASRQHLHQICLQSVVAHEETRIQYIASVYPSKHSYAIWHPVSRTTTKAKAPVMQEHPKGAEKSPYGFIQNVGDAPLYNLILTLFGENRILSGLELRIAL
jgi:hypothetical protein